MILTIARLRLFLATFLALTTYTMATPFHFNLTTVRGYFMQDEPGTDPDSFNYIKSNFGLIPRRYDTDCELAAKQGQRQNNATQWERFTYHLHRLNEDCRARTPGVSYRLLFLGRHGEGCHNVAEARYGSKAWNCHWSHLDGDANITWVDANLTEIGIRQAQQAKSAWKTQIAQGIPFPQSYYVSPLRRCLDTAGITFEGLDMPLVRPFQPVVKELLRETIGLHTCDARSPKSTIQQTHPLYHLEPRFSQPDPLWTRFARESNTARNLRLHTALFDIFAHDPSSVISITSHSGAIESVLNVTGHRAFGLVTGAMVPVLVRVERVAGEAPGMVVESPAGAGECPSN